MTIFAFRDPFFVTFCVVIPLLIFFGILIYCGLRRCGCCCGCCKRRNQVEEMPRDIPLDEVQSSRQEHGAQNSSDNVEDAEERQPWITTDMGSIQTTRLSCWCVWWTCGRNKGVPFTSFQQTKNNSVNSIRSIEKLDDFIVDEMSPELRPAEDML